MNKKESAAASSAEVKSDYAQPVESVIHSPQYITEDFFTSERTELISAALVKFHSGELTVEKKGKAPVTKDGGKLRSYVKLDDILNTVRQPLANAGLYVEQHLAGSSVITRVVHSSGQYIASRVVLREWQGQNTNQLQNVGGALTYLRRYAVTAILAIAADEDDDGATADGVSVNTTAGTSSTTRKAAPASDKPEPTEWLNKFVRKGSSELHAEWLRALSFVANGGKIEDIRKRYKVSRELATELEYHAKVQAQHNAGASATDDSGRIKPNPAVVAAEAKSHAQAQLGLDEEPSQGDEYDGVSTDGTVTDDLPF